jgi:hypothetical protein
MSGFGGSAWDTPTYRNPATGETWWNRTGVVCTPSDGTITVTVRVYDGAMNFVSDTDTIIADNTKPTVENVVITDLNTGSTSSISDGHDAQITAYINDTWQAYITTDMIYADTSPLGGAITDHPDYYDSTTGMAYWNLTNVICTPSNGTLTIVVWAYDKVGNQADDGYGYTIADNAPPEITYVLITDLTTGSTVWVKNGDQVRVNATIQDGNLQYMTTNDVWANLTGFGLGSVVYADSLNTTTGVAVWVFNVVSCNPANGVVIVWVHARDPGNNTAAPRNDTILADNIVPSVTDVLITDTTTSRTDYIVDGHDVSVHAVVTDANNLTITADMTGFGGSATMAPTYYSTSTGDAYWNLTNVVCSPSDGLIYVNITATDDAGNVGTGQDTIKSDNTAPVIQWVLITDTTIGSTDYVKDGDDVQVTALITDAHQEDMDETMITANLTCFSLGAYVNPDWYDTSTGTAYWNLTNVVCDPSNGVITVEVAAQD